MINARLRLLLPVCAVFLLAACASTPPTQKAPEMKPVDLKAAMEPAQFKATGLDKLSADQLNKLDSWLTNHDGRATDTATASSSPEPVLSAKQGKKDFGLPPKKEPEPDSITTRIAGHFDGWNGHTVFKLQNGQVWKQAGFGNFVYHADNPKVHIWKAWLGYLMRVEGYNATVAVRRVK
jgi:hypothetical protein